MESALDYLQDDLKACVNFHGHLCPGLVYGYKVAKEACRILGLNRASDEEVFTIAENDSCAVDALQVILGTTMGKGNLVLRDYGKNVFIIADRKSGRAVRFSRTKPYQYQGENASGFKWLDVDLNSGKLSPEQEKRQKLMKALDLLKKDFSDVFETKEVPMPEQDYAPLAPSVPCAQCGEMTMATKLVDMGDKGMCCVPCAASVRG